ncbi:FAS1 domain-containing protein [Polyplosphaeria fusca]|uniref:FAS1 domain-containing protein n=1 Tax=Polyplosphaeria fusca TaxID=682080 RepID=A0A9P4R7C0_9PLEO|nr:FAS1 domain-containing protein [Polyplosphaeria fusca]
MVTLVFAVGMIFLYFIFSQLNPWACALIQAQVQAPITPPTYRTVLEVVNLEPRLSHFSDILKHLPGVQEILQDRHRELTLFVPTNEAFDNSHDLLRSHLLDVPGGVEGLIRYHIIPWPIISTKLLCIPTLPTLLLPESLNGPQRLTITLEPSGLSVDGHAHIGPRSVSAENGQVHLVDAVLQPPEKSVVELVMDLPLSSFGWVMHALSFSGIQSDLDKVRFTGTFLVPSNWAFLQLGSRRLHRLFSTSGRNELRSILAAHFIPNQTLYSNAYYQHEPQDIVHNRKKELCPSGVRWFHLATLQPNVTHRVQVLRLAGLIEMLVDGYVPIHQRDLTARNGVVHVVDSLLAK